MVVDGEQSFFLFRFSEGSACPRERWATKLRDARNEDGSPTCRPKKGCKSNLSTVSVLANRSLHQDLLHSGCRGTTVPNVCLQALSLFSPFHPFPKQSVCSRAKTTRIARAKWSKRWPHNAKCDWLMPEGLTTNCQRSKPLTSWWWLKHWRTACYVSRK